MQCLEVSGAVRPIYGSVVVKRLMKLEVSRHIFEKTIRIPNFMKTRPVVHEFHADRRTDTTKLKAAFRKFCERA